MQQPNNTNIAVDNMHEEEEYEDEMSQMGGLTRQSDGVMRTPYRSVTPIAKNPQGQNQFQPGGRLEEVYGKNYNLRDPVNNNPYFEQRDLNQDLQDNRPINARMPM